jgi:hypothetical protein
VGFNFFNNYIVHVDRTLYVPFISKKFMTDNICVWRVDTALQHQHSTLNDEVKSSACNPQSNVLQ